MSTENVLKAGAGGIVGGVVGAVVAGAIIGIYYATLAKDAQANMDVVWGLLITGIVLGGFIGAVSGPSKDVNSPNEQKVLGMLHDIFKKD